MPHPFVSLYAKFEGATMKTVGGDSFCRTDRRTDGRTDGQTDGQSDGQFCSAKPECTTLELGT